MSFPDGAVVKNLPANAGDTGLISGSGRSPGGGNGNSLQYSWLEYSMDRGAWRATVHGVAKSQRWLKVYTHKGNNIFPLHKGIEGNNEVQLSYYLS